MPQFEFDAFLSYSTLTEYWLARRIEAFLEGLHETPGGKRAHLRPLQICRDGSDVRQRLSVPRASEDAIWERIRSRLAQSQRLIVLCSRQSSQAYWVDREIRWMIEHRGPEAVLLAVAAEADPVAAAEQVFAAPIREHRIDREQLWYDVRAWRGIKVPKQRDPADELVRLALDLLDVDKAEQAHALSIWQRETAKRQRQVAAAIGAGATIVLIAAGAAALGFWTARRNARAAQAASIVRTAQAESDARVASLLFVEASDLGLPPDALGIGHDLLQRNLPLAVLRGHTRAIIAAAFDGPARLTTIDRNGLILTRTSDGHGDPDAIATGVRTSAAALTRSDGTKAFLAGEDGTVVRVDLASRALIKCDVGVAIRSLSPSPAGDAVAIIAYDDVVRTCSFASAQTRAQSFSVDSRPIAAWPDVTARTWLAVTDRATAWRLDPAEGRAARLDEWSSRAGAETESFGEVLVADRSKDGRVLALASETRLMLIDARSGRTVRSSLEIAGRPSHLKLSPDATMIALAGPGAVQRFHSKPLQALPPLDARVRFYRIDPGEPSPQASEAFDFLALTWSPDGRYLTTLGGGRGIAVWDAAGGREPAMYYANGGADAVVWAADGTLFATSGDDGVAHVWRPSPNDGPSTLRIPARIYSGDISAAGDVFAVGTSESGLFFGSVDAARILRHMTYEELSAGCPERDSKPLRMVTFVAFDPTGSRLWIALDDGTVARMQVRGSSIAKGDSVCSSSQAVAMDRRSGRIAWVDDEGRVNTWAASGSVSRTGPSVAGQVSDLRFSTSGTQLAAAIEDGSVQLWNTADGQVGAADRWVAHAGAALCVSPGNRAGTLLSAGEDGKAYWWLAPNRRLPSELSDPQPGKWMERCALSVEEDMAFVASSSGRLWAWSLDEPQARTDISTSAELAQIGHINVLSETSDAAHLITGGGLDGTLRVWSTQGDYPLLSQQAMEGTVTVAAVSATRRYLLAAGESGLVRLLPMTGEETARLLEQRTSATLSVTERRRLLGEGREQARKTYEANERAKGRTPLPPDWHFEMPF
jgi:WD40 repeat protein